MKVLERNQLKNLVGGNMVEEFLEGGGGDPVCPPVVTNSCVKCDCTDPKDWCVGGLCTRRA